MTDGELGDLTLATVLLAVAGFVDAVGFLVLGHLFVSFASGNSTQFAIGAGQGALGKAASAGALVGFFVVGVFGGRLMAIAAKDWRRPAILLAEATLLAAAAVVPLSGMRAAFLMAFAMGAQNAVVHKAGRARTALTYVTGTLVNLGEKLADAVCSVGPGTEWAPYLALWAGLFLGGAVGGIAHDRFGLRALLLPAACALVLAALTAAQEWRRRDVRR
jgi:uncharacterized membrane protein YoaK (UPF0700 family)